VLGRLLLWLVALCSNRIADLIRYSGTCRPRPKDHNADFGDVNVADMKASHQRRKSDTARPLYIVIETRYFWAVLIK
jgi:hypothetical protein